MSRNSQSRPRNNDEDTRNQLSLDLDVKRARPVINQYKPSRRNQDEIVPSLGLHMLQTGCGRNSSGKGATSRPSDEFVVRKGQVRVITTEEEYEENKETFQDVKSQPSRKIVKGLLIVILLFMQGALMYSVYTNSPSDVVTQPTQSSVDGQLKHGLNIITNMFASITAIFETRKPFPFTHVQKRFKLGLSLLNELKDPSGAYVACSSVANAIIRHFGGNAIIGDSISSYITSVAAYLDEDNSGLLADALLCMGDAKLALFSPTSASTLSLNNSEMNQSELLYARDALEAAISVDPLNPAIRASLGLTFLLLGTVSDSDNIMQYLSQSIQHLNVALRSSPEKSNDPTHLAMMHNLGLANLALDSMSSDKDGQYHELLSTLQMDSSVLLVNKAATLIQLRELDDALSILDSISQFLACGNADMTGDSRQKDACLLLHQNSEVANALLHEDKTEKVIEIDNKPPAGETLESTSDLATNNATVVSGSSESLVHAVTDNGDTDDVQSEKAAAPQLQNAMQALENAASEGQHRPRLLLALAKARASMGDISGAINATITAINHATSVEETDSSTTYLETLMSKLAGEGNVEGSEQQTNQQPYSNAIKATNDRTISELELSLEIEKLKYRVLEQEHALKYQEMRLKSDQKENDYVAIGHSIDYTPDKTKTRSPIISNKPIESSSQAIVEDSDDYEEVKKSSFTEVGIHEIEEPSSIHVGTDADEPLSDDAKSTEINSEDGGGAPETTNKMVISSNKTEEENDQRISNEEAAAVEISTPEPEPIAMPSLFDPNLKPSSDLSAIAKSYMKIADAYLDKGKYDLASKQFLKVIRKAPDHLAAHLGYATALERAGKSKQLNDAAMAYGNATKVAVIQGDKVDPLAKAGAGGMAESILRRALQIAQSAPSGRLGVLRTLSGYAHTATLAADMYFAVGIELTKQGMKSAQTEAMEAFTIANEFIVMRNDTNAPCHIPSTIEMGKVALDRGNSTQAIEYFKRVKNLHLEDDDHVKLLVLSGKAHAATGDLDTAIHDFTRALSFPQCQSTPSAHHELALALLKNNGESHEINLHFEKALDLGMDPTDEAIAALGEHNLSIMRSYNRQHWRQMSEGQQSGSGGIMGGAGVGSQKSVFAPRAQEEQPSAQEETLSLLEQGAASYDGHVPMGDEVDGRGESSLSNLSGRKRTAT